MADESKPATMGDVARALGFNSEAAKLDPRMSLGTFRTEWAGLDDASKDQLKRGVGNGTMAY